MRFATLKLVLAGIAIALVMGCSGESDPAPSPTATIAASPTAQPVPTTPPQLNQTPESAQPGTFAQTVWLIDARTGGNKVLAREATDVIFGASFSTERDAVHIQKRALDQLVELELAFDGTELSRKPAILSYPCEVTATGVRVLGRDYADISCALVSPDARWMTYEVPAGEFERFPGYRVPVWDQWVIDLRSDQRRLLQAGLRHCGGCDGRFGPAWSPSSRFLMFPELIERVFLADLQTGTLRELAPSNQLHDKPQWAPKEDVLVRPSGSGTSILDRPATNTSTELPNLPWPARFDASGRYLYSPAFGVPAKAGQPTPRTTVFELASMRVVAELPGASHYLDLWTEHRVVAARGNTTVAALQGAPGCAGTTVYLGTQVLKCVDGTVGAAISPDGSQIAMARQTGRTGPIQGPGLQASDLPKFDIVLVDATTGNEKVVATDAVSSEIPILSWKPDSSRLLVKWPASYGL